MSAYQQYLQLKAATVTISDKDFYDEHTNLLKVLQSPSKKDDRAEYEEQRKELQDEVGTKHGPLPGAWEKVAREAFHERHGLPAPSKNALTPEETAAIGGLALGGMAGGAAGLGVGAAATYAYFKLKRRPVVTGPVTAGVHPYPHNAAAHVEALLRKRKGLT